MQDLTRALKCKTLGYGAIHVYWKLQNNHEKRSISPKKQFYRVPFCVCTKKPEGESLGTSLGQYCNRFLRVANKSCLLNLRVGIGVGLCSVQQGRPRSNGASIYYNCAHLRREALLLFL